MPLLPWGPSNVVWPKELPRCKLRPVLNDAPPLLLRGRLLPDRAQLPPAETMTGRSCPSTRGTGLCSLGRIPSTLRGTLTLLSVSHA